MVEKRHLVTVERLRTTSSVEWVENEEAGFDGQRAGTDRI